MSTFKCENDKCDVIFSKVKTIFLKHNSCVGIGYFCPKCSSRYYEADYRVEPCSIAEVLNYISWSIKERRAKNRPEIKYQILENNNLKNFVG